MPAEGDGASAATRGGRLGWLILLAALVAAIGLGTVARRTFYPEFPQGIREFAGSTMGTTWSLRAVLPEGAPDAWTIAIRDTVQARLDRVERVMSTWDSTSELSRFNRTRDTLPHVMSPLTLDVLRVAAEVGRESGGVFDVTVAPLVEAWGFGPGTEPLSEPPPPNQVRNLLERVGPDLLRIDARAGTVSKARSDVVVDLSAIAKGYGLDLAAQGVGRLGVSSFALEVGGEVRAVGSRPDGSPWRVAIEAPVAGSRSIYRVMDLRDESVATSGDYRNFYVAGGIRYSHIIDPRTGAPTSWRGFSVTVVHPEAVRADAWATALSVLGPEEGLRLAEQRGLSVLYVIEAGGRLESRATPPMASRLADPAS